MIESSVLSYNGNKSDPDPRYWSIGFKLDHQDHEKTKNMQKKEKKKFVPWFFYNYQNLRKPVNKKVKRTFKEL